jgi:putative ABC transport system permease protein
MIRLALRGLLARRGRTVMTAFAVVLGVGMISAALTVSDTMLSAANSLSSAAYHGTDAVVGAPRAFNTDENPGDGEAIGASALAQVRAVPQVGLAVGDILDQARLIDRHGKVIGTSPYFAMGYDSKTAGAQRFSPFHLTTGRWATGSDEVVIDAGTARSKHYAVGQQIAVAADGPVKKFTIVGVARFGSVESIGTATAAIFSLPVAQQMFGKVGRYDDVLAAAKPGVSAPALRSALRASLPPSMGVRSAQADDRFTLDGLRHFISFIKVFLLVFAVVALVVGAFTIFNTLSITVAQRTRELATLRTVGASRRQLLWSVIVETLTLGVVASAIGVIAGLGLAAGLLALLKSSGIDLPRVSTVFAERTVIVGMTVGVVATLLAGLIPAIRATSVSPITALREGAPTPKPRRRSLVAGLVIGGLGIAILGFALFAPGQATSDRLLAMIPGILALFVGVATLSGRVAGPLASLLGRPAQRFGGQAGALARRNAMRAPGRTAATAAALMIGIALVTFVAVLAHALQSASTGEAQRQIAAAYVVQQGSDGLPVPPAALAAVRAVPGVQAATGMPSAPVKVYGSQNAVNGVDPAAAQALNLDYKPGARATLATLRGHDAIVRDAFARKHHLAVGDSFAVLSQARQRLTLVVAGIEKSTELNPLNLGTITVARPLFDATFPDHGATFGFVSLHGGPSAATLASLRRALAPFPGVSVHTKAQFIKDTNSWLNSVLGIVYVLLAFAVIVSLFGIVNTLALAVLERTRELGMLRAVGMSRRQVRRMIRHESIITALIGATLGIGIGLFLGALVTAALSSSGMTFVVPVGSLVAFVIVAIVAGIVAAAAPARRAARLDVLGALAYQ